MFKKVLAKLFPKKFPLPVDPPKPPKSLGDRVVIDVLIWLLETALKKLKGE